ncbi:MAG: Ig-like domain-containing protein [Campylobacterales bacterium]|nr:Ig-like domain-containing protein [Campylobacterales bacterium]
MRPFLFFLIAFAALLGFWGCDGFAKPKTPERIEIEPKGKILPRSASMQLRAIGYYSDGSTQDLSSKVIWKSLDTAVLTCNEYGGLYGVSSGAAQVQVTFNQTLKAQSSIDVLGITRIIPSQKRMTISKGYEQALSLTALFENNATQYLDEDLRFSSGDPEVAQVDERFYIQGLKTGESRISYTIGGVQNDLHVRVVDAPLERIVIDARDLNLSIGTAQKLGAYAYFSDGRTEEISYAATWRVGDSAVALITSEGLLETKKGGSSFVELEYHGFKHQIPLHVSEKKITALRLQTDAPTLPIGLSQSLSVYALYDDGSFAPLEQNLTFQSSRSDILSIDETGLMRAHAAGTSAVHVRYGDFESSMNITVDEVRVLSIAIELPRYSLLQNIAYQPRALARLSDGRVRDITFQALWEATGGSVDVRSGGIVCLEDAKEARIAAQYGNLRDEVTLQAGPRRIDHLVLHQEHRTLSRGFESALGVTAVLDDNTTQPLSYDLHFESNNTAVAEVSPFGMIHARALGSASIQVGVAGRYASTRVEINDAALTRIELDPSALRLGTSMRYRLGARAYFSDGRVMRINEEYLYGSSDAAVALVTSDGWIYSGLKGSADVRLHYHGHQALTQVQVDEVALERLIVAPERLVLSRGFDALLETTGRFSDGRTLALGASSEFGSSDERIATVDSDGRIFAHNVGTCRIAVQNGAVSAWVEVEVVDAPLRSIVIAPEALELPPDMRYSYGAVAVFEDERIVNITNTALFESSERSVAAFDDTATLWAYDEGQSEVRVYYGGMVAATPLNVKAKPIKALLTLPERLEMPKAFERNLSVWVLFEDNTTMPLTQGIQSASSDETVATMDASGRISSFKSGVAILTLSYGALSRTLEVHVSDAVLESVRIEPASITLGLDAGVAYKAFARFSDGSEEEISYNGLWSVEDVGVASIGSDGLLQTHGVGTTTVAFYYGSERYEAALHVGAPRVNALLTSPQYLELGVGFREYLGVSALFEDFSLQDVTLAARYKSSNEAVLGVETNGELVARGVGAATVTVYYGDWTQSVYVQVSDAVATGLILEPSTLRQSVGATLGYRVWALLSDGSRKEVTSRALMQSEDTAIASVQSLGFIKAHQSGSVRLHAYFMGMHAEATFTFEPLNVRDLWLTPAAVTLSKGFTKRIAVDAIFEDMKTQRIEEDLQITALNPEVALASSQGMISALEVGTTTLTIRYGGIERTLHVTVNDAKVARLEWIDPVMPISLGMSRQLRARAYFSDGRVEEITYDALYQSSRADLLSVQSGLLVARGVGEATITLYYGAQTLEARIAINTASITAMTLTAQTQLLPVGFSATMKVTALFSDKRSETLGSDLIFESSDKSILSVDQSGRYTMLRSGMAFVHVSYFGMRAQIPITGTNATLYAIEIIPAAAYMPLGSTLPYEAKAIFIDNTQLDVTFDALWQSSDPQKLLIEDRQGVLIGLTRDRGSVEITILYAQRQAKTTLYIY